MKQIYNIQINTGDICKKINNEFRDLFNCELGTFNLSKVTLPIVKSAKPIFFKPRTTPLTWKHRLKQRLGN